MCIRDRLRMSKSDKEKECMVKAVEIAQESLESTIHKIKPGVTEKEFASELVIELLRNGSESELPFSPIREIVRSAEDKNDVIPFWFGEPDVSTPDFICESAKRSLDRGETFYAPNSGQILLRETICEYMNGIYGTAITKEQITVSISGMNALMIAAQALVPNGSKVIVLLPCWPNIPAIQRIMSGKLELIPIRMKDGKWNLDLDQVFDACD